MAEFSTDKRKELSQKGLAMPDGGYPIRNAADLQNAIQAFGRANDKPAVKAWIKKRAKELDLEKMLPTSWNSMSQSGLWVSNPADELCHHGILGMHWHHHNARVVYNSRYTKNQRNADHALLGKSGVNYVNKRLNKGDNHQTAYAKAGIRKVAKIALVSAGTMSAIAYVGTPRGKANIEKGAEVVHSFLHNMGSRDVFEKNGTITLNPKHVRDVASAVGALCA